VREFAGKERAGRGNEKLGLQIELISEDNSRLELVKRTRRGPGIINLGGEEKNRREVVEKQGGRHG